MKTLFLRIVLLSVALECTGCIATRLYEESYKPILDNIYHPKTLQSNQIIIRGDINKHGYGYYLITLAPKDVYRHTEPANFGKLPDSFLACRVNAAIAISKLPDSSKNQCTDSMKIKHVVYRPSYTMIFDSQPDSIRIQREFNRTVVTSLMILDAVLLPIELPIGYVAMVASIAKQDAASRK